jgi:hypothetical protein
MRPALASAPANPPSGTAAPTGNNGVSGRSRLGNGLRAPSPEDGEATMATSAERMRALRERERRGLQRLTIDVSENDLRGVAKRGYEGAATTDHDQQAQAVGLFLNEALLQFVHQ